MKVGQESWAVERESSYRAGAKTAAVQYDSCQFGYQLFYQHNTAVTKLATFVTRLLMSLRSLSMIP